MAKRIVKYNPAFLSKEELVSSFVVRHAELELIVQVLRENVTESNQHVLVIGPRGIGKTMLVRRVVVEIRRDKDLSKRWYPLVFAEESYPVTTPGEFWLEALFHLGEQTGDERWKQTYHELGNEKDEGRLREKALAQLMDFADAEGKRVLLVVENFNMLVGEQMHEDHGWTLRHTLLNEPRIMLLATATSRFEQIDNCGKAMFELFRTLDLKPLDEGECRTLWSCVTGEELNDERIRPLQILTGGSPRLVAIISTFAARMSLRELMDDLMQLVDDHTEYFKGYIDNLPAVERKAFLALADLWDPATAREVADASRLGVSKTSSLLRRLVERGAVVLANGQKRTKLYQVAERMYNIYYLMRRRGAPSRRVKALVRFMVPFYGPKDIVSLTQRFAEEACKLDPEARMDHFLAYEAIVESAESESLRNKLIKAVPKEFFEMPDLPTSVKRIFRTEIPSEVPVEETRIDQLLKEGEELTEAGKLDQAEKAYRKAIEIDEKSAEAWTDLGSLLCVYLERNEEAEKAYRKAIKIDEKYARAWGHLGLLLHEKLERYKEAKKAYRKLIELKPDIVWGHTRLGLLLHEKLGRYEEAEKAYRKAIKIDEKYARAWGYLGLLLHEKLERYEGAEKAYRKAIDIDEKDAWAWAHLGLLLHEKLERYDEAEKAYRKAIDIDEKDAWAWAHLGLLLHEKLERYDEAEKAYRKAIEIDEKFAWAWARLGWLLHEKLERYEEAEKAYRKAIKIDEKYAGAWAGVGWLLHKKLERYDEAEKAYRKAIEIEPDVAWGHANLGQLLHEKLERYDEAEEAYRKAIETEPRYFLAVRNLVVLLQERGHKREAVTVAEECLSRNPNEASLLNSLAWTVYEHRMWDMLAEAEVWAKRAVELEPNEGYFLHTLASILCISGKETEALERARDYLNDKKSVEKTIDDAIDLFIGLAAGGYERESLKILGESPSAEILEPLVVGLRIYVGEDVKAAAEIMEVGKDVVKRIEQRRKEMSKKKKAGSKKKRQRK